jgi:hypothetical protein
MAKRAETHGYCSDCGLWSETCRTVVLYGAPERVCRGCRQVRGLDTSNETKRDQRAIRD